MTTCDLCDNTADFTDVQVKNGVHKTTNLCREHAEAAGFNIGKIGVSIVLNVSSSKSSELSNVLTCPDCNYTIAQYKESSLLGCPTCYKTFANQLKQVISSVQDAHTHHIGRAPAESEGINKHLEIRRLLKELEQAVTHEKYEQAANIRDKIRELHDCGEQD
jgi:protein-arginine kinase activator protein McsA